MRQVERRAIDQLERRRQLLFDQINMLVADRLSEMIWSDPELLAEVQACDPDNYDSWSPELKRRGFEVFQQVVAVSGAGQLVIEHDRLAERLNHVGNFQGYEVNYVHE